MNLLSHSLFIGLLTAVMFVSGCNDDEEGTKTSESQTVWEIVKETDNLSSLESELSAFESIVETLNDEDATLTLFAPSNAALSTLLSTLGLENFSSIAPTIAQAVLEYHVVTSAALASNALPGSITTEQGETITVTNGKLVSGATNDASVQQADVAAANGVIHIVDVVLVPPTIGQQVIDALGTLAQPILLGADFVTLAAGIVKADAGKEASETIQALLISGDGLTVFAPTNATFIAANLTVESFTAEKWDAIARNHIVKAQGTETKELIGENDLQTGATFTTVGGGTLTIFSDPSALPSMIDGPGIYIDSNGDVDLMTPATYTNFDAEVARLNAAPASNGTIHVIGGILKP